MPCPLCLAPCASLLSLAHCASPVVLLFVRDALSLVPYPLCLARCACSPQAEDWEHQEEFADDDEEIEIEEQKLEDDPGERKKLGLDDDDDEDEEEEDTDKKKLKKKLQVGRKAGLFGWGRLGWFRVTGAGDGGGDRPLGERGQGERLGCGG